MTKQQENLITAIDVGSAKTFVLVAESTEGGIRYLGHGAHESRGSRKGAIVDLEKAVACIHRAVEKAEAASGATVEAAVVGVGGTHLRGLNSRGGISLAARPREVTREDIRAAVEKARAVTLPADWHVLHLLPQEFILDDQNSIRDPAGMLGIKLEVQVHVVAAIATVTQTVVTALNRAGVEVQDTIFEPLACADCVLKPDERELGVCLVDVGAGTSELAVYHEGVVVHSGVIPIGGDHFTNDVAVGLRTALADAEKIKRSFGSAVVTRVPEGNEIEVPAVGDRPSRLMPQRFVAEILEPRAGELFEHLRDNLRQAHVLDRCAAGTVLTGGGAKLAHLPEIAEQVLHRPSRLGRPLPIAKLPAELAGPEYATAIGLISYANRARFVRRKDEASLSGKLRSFLARASM
jgi:cell division protein FtsA